MKSQSLESDSEHKNALDAYSAQAQANPQNGKNTCQATLVGVSGDFFAFHKYKLLSGSYIDKEEKQTNGIVIDDNTAWALFGSNDVTGKTVELAGQMVTIRGVCQMEQNWFHQKVIGDRKVVFVPFALYEQITGSGQVQSYETVLPNPVDGIAKSIVKSSMEMVTGEEMGAELVENTNRFRFHEIGKHVQKLSTRSVVDQSIRYSYWENTARIAEDVESWLVIGIVVLMVYITIGGIRIYRNKG